MKLCVLGSGSGGNCAVILGPGGSFLIDAGLSARQIVNRLDDIGIGLESLVGVLLTHEHTDHTRGLDVLLRGPLAPVPIFCNGHTCAMVRPTLREDKRWRLIETGSAFFLAGLRVETFSVPHDAVDPIGFVLENPASGSRLGILSDIGHATTNVLARLRDLDGLFVEANYCPSRLANDLKRPWATKQRISSRHGHLSNDQAADLVSTIASPRLRRLLLGHLSRECNCPVTAVNVLAGALARRGFTQIEIVCATQDRPTALFAIVAGGSVTAMKAVLEVPAASPGWQQPELFM